jgi:CAAX protease family protein
VLLALALGRWLKVAPFETLAWTWRGLAWGIMATAPLLLGLAWCLRTTVAPVARLVQVAEQRIAPLFAASGPVALAIVAVLAGLGEETLFRGVIQPALATHLPVWAALAVTAVLFGLLHWVTPTYALLAGIVGAYLGVLLLVSGNLLAPIVAHALYDLVALTLLVRLKPALASSVL